MLSPEQGAVAATTEAARTSRFRRSPAGAAILLAILCAVAAAQPLAQQPAPAVIVAPAEMADLRSTNDFTGRLVAIQKVDVRARVSGFVQEVAFVEGAQIAAGDVLYRIEPDAYRAAIAEIEGAIRSAEASKRLAEIERDRKATLLGRNVVAQLELDIAEAQLGKAEGEVQRLRGQLDRARLDLSYTDIVAPFDGTVGLTGVDVGALVGPDSPPLTTLTRLDRIHAEFPVATATLLRHRAQVRAGEASNSQTVRLALPDGTTYPLKGDLDYVDAAVAQGTDTVTVRAVFDNPDRTLLDGALVTVSLEAAEAQMVLSVPQQAVQTDQVGAFVMVVDDEQKVAVRRVSVARNARGRAVISDGLKEGERVIIEGLNKVRPGVVVDAVTASAGG